MTTDGRPMALRRIWPLLACLLLGWATGLHAAPPAGGVWQTVFSDHFKGTHLNEASWTDASLNDTPVSGSTYYGLAFSRPHIVEHALRFFLEPQADAGKTGIVACIATGPVHTANNCHLQYGYLEMRIRVPKGPYLCAARLLPVNPTPSTASITLFTTAGAPDGGLCCGVALAGEPVGQTVTISDPAADLTNAPHLLGLLWTPQEIVWYLDGQPVARSAKVPSDKMYLTLSFQLAHTPTTNQDPRLTARAEFLVSDVQMYHQVGEVDSAPPLLYNTQLDTHLSIAASSSKMSTAPNGAYSTDTYYAARHYVDAITLLFDEPLNKASAENAAHYQVNGARVKRAKLRQDRCTVVLELKEVDQHDLSLLHITGVTDLAGNTAPLTVTIGNNPFVTSPRE